MKQLGGYMFFFGVGSIVLYFLNLEFILLSWIEMWGPKIAWLIRGALAAVGGALWILGGREAENA